jgi:peroxiredoxin Q/BCP
MPTLTNEMIEAAINGFQQQKIHIDEQIASLRSMLNRGSSQAPAQSSAEPRTGRKSRKFSPEARARMREAQQRRWAKIKGASPEANAAPAKAAPAKAAPAKAAPAKQKRRLSPEGRKRIVEALKKRWAAKKAGTKTAGSKSAKSAAAA